MNPIRFDQRVAIITSASSGLGRLYATALATRGAAVVAAEVNREIRRRDDGAALHHLVEEIRGKGGVAQASYEPGECADKIVSATLSAYGRVDILINHGWLSRDGDFQDMQQNDWEAMCHANLSSALRITQAAWRCMQANRYGRIINTISAAGLFGSPGEANYALAALGLVGLTKSLAIDGSTRNITVNAISATWGNRLLESISDPRLLDIMKPEVVVALVLRLCADHNRDTGSIFEVALGRISVIDWLSSQGADFRHDSSVSAEAVDAVWEQLRCFDGRASGNLAGRQ